MCQRQRCWLRISWLRTCYSQPWKGTYCSGPWLGGSLPIKMGVSTSIAKRSSRNAGVLELTESTWECATTILDLHRMLPGSLRRSVHKVHSRCDDGLVWNNNNFFTSHTTVYGYIHLMSDPVKYIQITPKRLTGTLPTNVHKIHPDWPPVRSDKVTNYWLVSRLLTLIADLTYFPHAHNLLVTIIWPAIHHTLRLVSDMTFVTLPDMLWSNMAAAS